MNLICTSANIFTLLTLQIISNNDTGFDSMRSGGCGIGCSATVFLQTTTSSTYVRVSAQLVKAFTTGVNSDLPTLPSFRGKTSLSLSNWLSFALIPLVKIVKNSKNFIFYFRSPISPWTGPQLKLLFRAFFLSMFYIFTMQKISLSEHWP